MAFLQLSVLLDEIPMRFGVDAYQDVGRLQELSRDFDVMAAAIALDE
jgi:hypothetical protein